MSTQRLAGKVAFLTGGSKGLGPHLAQKMIAEGAKVALLARESAELHEVAGRLGDSALAVACDVADRGAVRAGFAAAAGTLGGLDFLINNAAIALLHRLEEATDEELALQVGVNFLGPLHTIREAVPLMRARGGGHIVNVSSQSVAMSVPYMTLYGATKGGLEALTAGLRSELRGDNIKLTAMRMGAMRVGKGLTRYWTPERKAAYLESVRASGMMNQLGGWMEPPSVAAALADLLAQPADLTTDFVEITGR